MLIDDYAVILDRRAVRMCIHPKDLGLQPAGCGAVLRRVSGRDIGSQDKLLHIGRLVAFIAIAS